MSIQRTLAVAFLVLAMNGCDKKGTQAPSEDKKDVMAKEKILQQASFDLQCDKEQLVVQKISDDQQAMGVKNTTWGARGCDKQATYKSTCMMGDCQVSNDSGVAAAGGATE